MAGRAGRVGHRRARRPPSATNRSSGSGPRRLKFVKQSVGELRKVVYPTGEQLIKYFVVVLVFVLFVIACIGRPARPRLRRRSIFEIFA